LPQVTRRSVDFANLINRESKYGKDLQFFLPVSLLADLLTGSIIPNFADKTGRTNGVFKSTAKYGVNTKGKVLSFNGSSDYTQFPTDARLNFTGNFTVSVWFYLTGNLSGNSFTGLISKDQHSSGIGWFVG